MKLFRNAALRLTLFNAMVILVILSISSLVTYLTVRHLVNSRLNDDLLSAAAAFQTSPEFQGAFPGGWMPLLRQPEEAAVRTATYPAVLFDADGGLLRAVHASVDELERGELEEEHAEDEEEEHGELEEGHEEEDEQSEDLLTAAAPALRASLGGSQVVGSIRGTRHWVRVLSVPVVRDGSVIGVVQFMASEEDERALLRIVQLSLVGVGLAGILATAGAGYALSVRALGPLREAFRRQREFIRGASHQLRTPVAVVRADAEALSRSLHSTDGEAGGLSEPDAELLEDLTHEADFLGRVIQQLVVGARLEGSEDDVAHKPVDLGALVRDTAEAIRPLASEQGVALAVQAPEEGSPQIRGEPTQLRLALLGLLDNAVKYGGQGGTVRVTLETSGRWAVVAVADTGPGLQPDEQERVFDEFYRGAGSRERASEGAGLGLPIARQVARAHGGDVTLTSRPGEGTVVVLRVPV